MYVRTFASKGMPSTYSNRVQIAAVLKQLAPGVVPWQPETVKTATWRLVERWRQRVAELLQAGYEPLVGEGPAAVRAMRYMVNCRPAFLVIAGKTFCCNRVGVCPFCWSRQVHEYWTRIDQAFFPKSVASEKVVTRSRGIQLELPIPAGPPDPQRRSPFVLVERSCLLKRVERTVLLDRLRVPSLVELIRQRREPQKGQTRREFLYLKPEGMFETVGVGLTDEVARPWNIRIRQLLLVSPEWHIIEGTPEYDLLYGQGAYKVRRWDHPTRRQLLFAVARACRYPESLLRGNAADLVELLRVRQHRKLNVLMGVFRKPRTH